MQKLLLFSSFLLALWTVFAMLIFFPMLSFCCCCCCCCYYVFVMFLFTFRVAGWALWCIWTKMWCNLTITAHRRLVSVAYCYHYIKVKWDESVERVIASLYIASAQACFWWKLERLSNINNNYGKSIERLRENSQYIHRIVGWWREHDAYEPHSLLLPPSAMPLISFENMLLVNISKDNLCVWWVPVLYIVQLIHINENRQQAQDWQMDTN